MRDCLGSVVTSLLFFLDHPDSRVRLNAARTLLKLKEGYSEDVASLDLARARSALKRGQEAEADGNSDVDGQELRGLLMELLGEGKARDRPPLETAVAAAADEERGQVVLKVSEQADSKLRAAMLEKVVAVDGVVSMTFEGDYIIVASRTQSVASDAGFLADLLSAVKTQGSDAVSLVSTGGKSSASMGLSSKDGPSGGGYPGSAATSSTAPAEAPPPDLGIDDVDEADQEPAYLDDEDDLMGPALGSSSGQASGGASAAPAVGAAGMPQWSFFSQSQFIATRRVLEYDDDPALAARLAKKKKQEQQRKEEEKSRIGRLSSWLTGR
mmetsp:Transcript_71492/g.126279  ORF Transcript_71492/g.126279 Transcript_71492/m.126279 type:complete len:326 (+) Transcript_71492:48-1025(+)